MKTKITIALLIALALMNSCKKDEKSNTDLLCGKYWVANAATIDPSVPIVDDYGNITGYTNDIFNQMDPCDRDDVQQYHTDGTYTWDARVKCDVGDTQSGSGTWMFNSDETMITETQGSESMSYTIVELTESKYKFSYDMVFSDVNYKLTITCITE